MVSAQINPRAKSVWMTPAASTALLSPGIVQARLSLGAGGEIGDQAKQFVPGANDAFQAGTFQPEAFQEFALFLGVVELGDL